MAPYGVYDLTADEGWVSVGIDHDTAEFAVGLPFRLDQFSGSRPAEATTRPDPVASFSKSTTWLPLPDPSSRFTYEVR